MSFWKKLFGSKEKESVVGTQPVTVTPNVAAESSKLTLRYDDLLGIIVWIQAPSEVCPEEHPAAMKFFKTHNPQAIDFIKTHRSKRIQIGVEKIDKPKDEFVKYAVEDAVRQAKQLDPCVLIVQHGSIQTDDLSVNQSYVIGSFFHGLKSSLVIPQPGTQIVLE